MKQSTISLAKDPPVAKISTTAVSGGEPNSIDWRQGDILTQENLLTISSSNPDYSHFQSFDFGVVVSNDCDIVANLEVEPSVEVLLARRIDKSLKDGNYYFGKNPRLLQFEYSSAQRSLLVQASIHDRNVIDKSLLAKCKKADGQALTAEIKRIIITWIVKRYRRAAFPDIFNDRMRPIRDQVRQTLRLSGELITGIWMIVEDVEKKPEDSYNISIFFTMREEDFSNHEANLIVQRSLDQIAGQFDGCAGVIVRESMVLSVNNFSLGMLEVCKRYDTDDLSLRTVPQGLITSGD